MSKQLCTFMVGEILFGIDVLSIQEVIRPSTMTRVPLASSVIRGLINLRGQILTVFDLRERLGLPPAPADGHGMNVVINLPDGAISLLVDQVGEVLEVSDDQFEAGPATLQGALRDVTLGIYKLKNQLLLLLDVTATVDAPAKTFL